MKTRNTHHLMDLYRRLLWVACCVAGIPTMFCGFLFLIPGFQEADGFRNLGELEAYAKHFDEPTIEMENNNPVKPDYTKFYRTNVPGWLQKKLQKLGLKKALPWSVLTYKSLLDKVTAERKKQGFSGNFVHKILPTSGSRIIIWGDIQGALHSLARDLRELVKQNMLTEDFKLVSADDYLVFTGDVVSRSPFIMETLSLVARLMLANPDHVFYCRGNHEAGNYWQEYGLKRELKIRASQFSYTDAEQAPLVNFTNDFFDILPTMLYFAVPAAQDQQFIRISHEGSDGENRVADIDDKKFYQFLSTKADGRLKTINFKDLKDGAPITQQVTIKAILKAEIKRKTYQSMCGLRLTSPENGITAWTMISCPTEVYRKGLEFFYDAFSVISVGQQPNDWKIKLFNQDVRKLDGFKNREYILATGQQISGDVAPMPPAEAPVPTPAATTQANTPPIVLPVVQPTQSPRDVVGPAAAIGTPPAPQPAATTQNTAAHWQTPTAAVPARRMQEINQKYQRADGSNG